MKRHRTAAVVVEGDVVGQLSENEAGFIFLYHADYLARPTAQPISLTLPLRAHPYQSAHLHPYFFGLLTEGDLAHVQCRLLHLDERDYFGRLLATCRDPVGHVTIHPESPTATT